MKINEIYDEIIYRLSKHPYDWGCHFIMCFIPLCIIHDWKMILIVMAFGGILEYEQKFQKWYDYYSWKEYLLQYSLGDMIANLLGALAGYFVKLYL